MSDSGNPSADGPAPHPYVSDTAITTLRAAGATGWRAIEGSLAFFDVSGFTALTERLANVGRSGAEHINDLLNTVFETLIDEALAGGGDVLEFGGDAMVVLFAGGDHERVAAVTAARMFAAIAEAGRFVTPAGTTTVRLSCGIASGTQAYHLLGSTRRALAVTGPVSSTMTRLQTAAQPGEVLVSADIAAALPPEWTEPVAAGFRLRRRRIPTGAARRSPAGRPPVADGIDPSVLLPTQLRHRPPRRDSSGELKQVAMAFIRLDGTDDLLGARGVDAVQDLLRGVTECIDCAASALDVCWLETQTEFDGLRWTLVAGAPDSTERDSERMLRVLRRIADTTPAGLRIGANLGTVYAGDMGHPARCTYIVMGDATNLAARLMTHAAPGEIVAGQALFDASGRRFEGQPIEPFPVKGKRASVSAVSVGPESDVAASERDGAAPVVPMVGRDAQLERLLQAIDAAAVVDLVGEPGVGKTRLWQEARGATEDRTWTTIAAEPHETGTPYAPFRRTIRVLAGIARGDAPSVAGRKLASLLTGRAPLLARWLPLIADLVGAEATPTVEADALDPAFRGDRLDAVLGELLLESTGGGGVIVIDDIHWLDESSRGLLDLLCRIPDRDVAIVTTRRPGASAPQAAMPIEVVPIDAGAAERLLLELLPARASSDATVARLRASAAGNPLYLIELARSVGARGPAPSGESPASVERLLSARIDRLPVAGRQLVRDASVFGSNFGRSLASEVLERPDLLDPRTWERELGDLIVIEADRVRFRHDLVRAVAYGGLSGRRRQAVHRRAGDVIEASQGVDLVDDRVSALAVHAAGSGLDARIVQWGAAAAEAALATGASEIGETLLTEVVDAERRLGLPAAERTTTLQRKATAAERAGHPEAALEALSLAARLASDGTALAAIAVDRARLLEKLGRYRSAAVVTTRALAHCDDPAVAGRLLMSRATLWNFQGRWRDCLELCRALLSDDAHAADTRLVAQAHLLAEWCCTSLGTPAREAHAAAAFELLEQLDDSIGLANLLLNRGVSAWRENRPSDAIADFRSSSGHYLRAGDVVGAALSDNNLAELLTLQFHIDDAERLLRHARRVTIAANYPHGTWATVSGLSRIEAWRGRTETAYRLQSQALAGFRELGTDDFVVDSLVRLVEILVIAGDDRALDLAEQAAAALDRLGPVPLLPAALARLRARALLARGDRAAARRDFERALTLARADAFTYEEALAELGLARLAGDQAGVAAVFARLAGLGVLAPPPGS